MTRVAIIGDGPGGLSAALFLAKSNIETRLFGTDETAMHHAHLYNYLGIDEIAGSDFQQRARAQVTKFGAQLHDAQVTAIARKSGSGFTVTTAHDTYPGDYVILAGGKAAQALAAELGVTKAGKHLAVDSEFRTNVDRVYAVGRLIRPERSQAIISAGAGATAALDILAREAGKDITDWDTPDD